ncbi:MFS transporter [Acidisphaera sp. S103]|uniref:MFS transporter n=1 Tax=Acidisphaera sp. S103 TaxID=1747223 RepID=UPI00131CE034|nr:MFS transporter [Acidisphaera sp. S103]
MVLVSFIVGFVVFGTLYSFGAFFEPMSAEFKASQAAVSAFFSITGLTFYLSGSVVGYLGDRFGPAIMVTLGAAVMGGGLILTGFIGQMWEGYLTYGVAAGIGAACAYIPTLAVLGGWFVQQRNAAFGTAAAGSGCGMLIVPLLSAVLIEWCGWRNTSVIIGAVCATLLTFAAVLVRPPPMAVEEPHRAVGPIVRSFEFLMLYASWVLATTALFVPFVFLPTYASTLGSSRFAGSALLAILGGVSILGRLGIGALGAKVGTRTLFKASVLLMAMSYLLWLTAPSYPWLVVFAAALGLGYGLRMSLMPSVLIELFGVQHLGAVLGIFFTASGVSAILGPPLAGFVVDMTGNYQWSIVFALLAGTTGFALIVPLKIFRGLVTKTGRTVPGSAEVSQT